MSEKLSVRTAIIGLVAASGKAIDVIWDLRLPATKVTPVLNQALQDVKQCRTTALVLYKALSLLELAQLPFLERGMWIGVDGLVATLTETVLALSEIQTICTALDHQRQAVTSEAPCDYKLGMVFLCSQIRWHNLSMTMMTSILKW